MNLGAVPTGFIDKWKLYFASFDQIQWMPFMIGAIALAILIIWPKINKKIPASLISIIVTTALVAFKIRCSNDWDPIHEFIIVIPNAVNSTYNME